MESVRCYLCEAFDPGDQTMRVKSFLVACGAAILLASCENSGEYYEKTPQQVASALKSAYVPTAILGGAVASSRVTQPDDTTIVTALVDQSGSEVMRFVTTVTPDGTGARVATEIRPPEGKNKARASEAMETNGAALDMMERLADEHVAAAIEGRPFDMMFASPPMAKGMMNAVPGLSERVGAANAAASEFSRGQQQTEFERKYGDDWGRSAGDATEGWAE